MNTEIIYINDEKFNDAELLNGARLLADGKTVVFPTETVYGLGANALDEQAVDKIYIAKGRPSDNPLIVHIGNIDKLDELINEIPDVAQLLIDRFWPGPLTMIFKKSDLVPLKVTGGLDTVAIRMPEHNMARRLIELSGVPVAAPSANISGKPSPTTKEHVVKDLEGRVDMIICSGNAEVGVESTVLDLTSNPPMVLRPGGVTLEQLRDVIGEVDVDPHLKMGETYIPKSPGMKYTHYSPKGEVIVVEGKDAEVISFINERSKSDIEDNKGVGIIASDETANEYNHGRVISVGSKDDLSKVASNIFNALRSLDKDDIKVIYAEAFPQRGIGQAIMNRLTKAAGNKVIKLD